MSAIHYKFKSAKDYDTYRFEGAGIPVWDLKNEIIRAKKLEKSQDFDLVISNAQTNEDYTSDSMIIPKNTSVIVKRIPAPKQRQFINKAAVQLATAPVEIKGVTTPANQISFAGYLPVKPVVSVIPASDPRLASASGGTQQQDEDARIEAMMMANSSAWDQNQQHINADGSGFQKRFRPPSAAAFRGLPAVPPPPYYVCFRCGQKGHYINNCPTNSDPTFDKPRVKKSTGIPRSFLKSVASEDSEQALMVTADGSLVVAVSNDQEWQRLSTAAAKTKAFDRSSLPPEIVVEEGLKCKICSLLLLDAVSCPQCPALFCDDCMRSHWKDSVAKCPSCQKRISADQLLPSESARKQVEQFILKVQKSSAPPSESPPLPPNFVPPPLPMNPLMPMPFFPFPPFPLLPGMPPFIPPFPLPPRPPVATASQPAPSHAAEAPSSKKRSRSRSRSRSHSRSRSPPYERSSKEHKSRQK